MSQANGRAPVMVNKREFQSLKKSLNFICFTKMQYKYLQLIKDHSKVQMEEFD